MSESSTDTNALHVLILCHIGPINQVSYMENIWQDVDTLHRIYYLIYITIE